MGRFGTKTHPFIERDPNKCIVCSRCFRICKDVMGINAIKLGPRILTPPKGPALEDTKCVSCGQCVATCPVGALTAKNEIQPEKEISTIMRMMSRQDLYIVLPPVRKLHKSLLSRYKSNNNNWL